jgi:hypothetical protein
MSEREDCFCTAIYGKTGEENALCGPCAGRAYARIVEVTRERDEARAALRAALACIPPGQPERDAVLAIGEKHGEAIAAVFHGETNFPWHFKP